MYTLSFPLIYDIKYCHTGFGPTLSLLQLVQHAPSLFSFGLPLTYLSASWHKTSNFYNPSFPFFRDQDTYTSVVISTLQLGVWLQKEVFLITSFLVTASTGLHLPCMPFTRYNFPSSYISRNDVISIFVLFSVILPLFRRHGGVATSPKMNPFRVVSPKLR